MRLKDKIQAAYMVVALVVPVFAALAAAGHYFGSVFLHLAYIWLWLSPVTAYVVVRTHASMFGDA